MQDPGILHRPRRLCCAMSSSTALVECEGGRRHHVVLYMASCDIVAKLQGTSGRDVKGDHHGQLPILGNSSCPDDLRLFWLPGPGEGQTILQLLAHQQLQPWQGVYLRQQHNTWIAMHCIPFHSMLLHCMHCTVQPCPSLHRKGPSEV